MPRLLVGNFDVEHQWADSSLSSRSRNLQQLCDELAVCWLAIAAPGDGIWTPRPWADDFLSQLREHWPNLHSSCDLSHFPAGLDVTPWGWSQQIIQQTARSRGWCLHPPLDVVRHVNSRNFSFALETEFGCTPPRMTQISHLDAIQPTLNALCELHPSHRWVIKAKLSMSARERILGQGTQLSKNALNWITRRLATQSPLFLEPWLDRIAEVGIQWTVPPEGPVILEGITPLFTDSQGQYLGSQFSAGSTAAEKALLDDWRPALDITRRAVERIQSLGYFGPVGIDAMKFRNARGEIQLRPLQDINARWTMGRLSLGLRRLAKPGERGLWRIEPTPTNQPPQSTTLPNSSRTINITPRFTEGQPSRRRILIEFTPTQQPVAGYPSSSTDP